MSIEGVEALNLQDKVQTFMDGEGLQHAEVLVEERVHPIYVADTGRIAKGISSRSSKVRVVLVIESGGRLIRCGLRAKACAVPQAVYGRIGQTSFDDQRIKSVVLRGGTLD